MQTFESKGFRLSGTKTEYMGCGFSTTRHEKRRGLALMGRSAGGTSKGHLSIFEINAAEG